MPAVARLGDVCSGHSCWPPRPNVQASPNVHVNGIPVHRLTDGWASHCCGPVCHGGSTVSGSPNVHANGLARARIGDAVSCGSTVAEGSPNVFANGG